MAVVKWSGLQQYDSEMKQYIATHYEPKLQFDPVPVYDVTLAEDTPSGSPNADNYIIPFSNSPYGVYVVIKAPVSNIAASVAMGVTFGTNNKKVLTISDGLHTSQGRTSTLLAMKIRGLLRLFLSKTAEGSFGSTTNVSTTLPLFVSNTELLTSVILYYNTTGSGVAIPAGTQITAYNLVEV